MDKIYKTDDVIKAELVDLVKFARKNDVHHDWEAPEKIVDDFLRDKDVAYSAGGNFRIIKGVSERNAVRELVIAIGLVIGTIAISLWLSFNFLVPILDKTAK